MKPKNLALFSLINRYWYGFCRSDKMQGYWYRHVLQISSWCQNKIWDRVNWYELYYFFKTLSRAFKNQNDAKGRENRIVAIDSVFQFIANFSQLSFVFEHLPNFKNICKIKLRQFYLEDNWEKANEYHQIFFHSSIEPQGT